MRYARRMVRVIANVRPLKHTSVRIFTRHNVAYATVALLFGLIGYGAAAFLTKRTAVVENAMTATAGLWYSYEVLRTLEGGDAKSALQATALKADQFVSQIAEAEDRTLSEEQGEFRERVLKMYKTFRDAHPSLYALPSQIGAQEKDDMLRKQLEVSEFLKRKTK